MTSVPDLAQIRFINALALFDEFVSNTIKHPDAATLRGLESRFAERVQIQPSYWSQIKGRSRQIGERLARQFEQLCHKPNGWMDKDHSNSARPDARGAGTLPVKGNEDSAPRDDDERFIVSLVLSYYRRHPQRARTRLLDLLGEVLMPGTSDPGVQAATKSLQPKAATLAKPLPQPAVTPDATDALWKRMQAGVAPLRQKK